MDGRGKISKRKLSDVEADGRIAKYIIFWQDQFDLRMPMKKGDEGADVVKVQSELKRLGYEVPDITGVFDDKTDSAVRAFQAKCGLLDDGIFGPASAIAFYRQLRPGTIPSLNSLQSGA